MHILTSLNLLFLGRASLHHHASRSSFFRKAPEWISVRAFLGWLRAGAVSFVQDRTFQLMWMRPRQSFRNPFDFLFPVLFLCSLNTSLSISFMALQLHPNCTWSLMTHSSSRTVSTWTSQSRSILSSPSALSLCFWRHSHSSMVSPVFLFLPFKLAGSFSRLPFFSPCLCAFLPLCYCCLFVCHVSVCSEIHQMARADMSSVISPAPLPVYVWTNVLVSMPWHSCIYAPLG